MNNSQNSIEQLAYQLWEAEGRPWGKSMKHWQEAEAIIDTLTKKKQSNTHKPTFAQQKSLAEQQPDQT